MATRIFSLPEGGLDFLRSQEETLRNSCNPFNVWVKISENTYRKLDAILSHPGDGKSGLARRQKTIEKLKRIPISGE